MAGFTVGGAVAANNVIPSSYKADHDTDGLPGFPADDWFRPAGTVVGSPVDGVVEYVKKAGGGSGVYGWHIRIKGNRGQDIFLTHFDDTPFVRGGQRILKGQALGRVAPYGSASHIHVSMRSSTPIGRVVNMDAGGGVGGSGTRVPGIYDLPRQSSGIGSGLGSAVTDAGKGVFRGITGTDPGLIGDVLDGLLPGDPVDELGERLQSGALRLGMILGGFVLVVIGLLVLARAAGAPTPAPLARLQVRR